MALGSASRKAHFTTQGQNRSSTASMVGILLWPWHGHKEGNLKGWDFASFLSLWNKSLLCKGSLWRGTTAITAPPSRFPPFLPTGPKVTLLKGRDSLGKRCCWVWVESSKLFPSLVTAGVILTHSSPLWNLTKGIGERQGGTRPQVRTCCCSRHLTEI